MTPSTRRPLTALALSLALLQAPPLAAEEAPPNRAAFALDLTGAPDTALAAALRHNLAALLDAARYTQGPGAGAAAAPRITSLAQVIAQLRRHPAVAYVVLAERATGPDGATAVTLGPVFVVPDLVAISISGTAPAAPVGTAPEATLVPGQPGEPPRIRFQFDPAAYEQPRP